jgi:hypothetical protein
MPELVASNPNVPHTDQPVADLQSLTSVAIQLRQGMESLGGHRGGPYDRAVTLKDLMTLGLVSEATIRSALRGS